MVTVRPDLIHDAIVDPVSPPALRAVPAPPEAAEAVDEPVWVSPSVEGFHTSAHCSALLSDIVSRQSPPVTPFRMERAVAEEQGLRICKWCRAWQQML